ncbi:MAG TPA: polyamine aminopropyltransferase [Syntrophomonadaceae bacterium]|nr:polyamine aminopropyltransferase [Syntrophomonadaceae bacterium]HNX29700.1 polyamine aminopropyltransferase [Syntrophomonadaceae bacterium]HPR92960.1 polyamine aminopropyltransferase [Syntrophomonadaceae bacterium]
MNNIWFYENHTPGYEVRWKITDILHEEKSDFQLITIVETLELGRAMILDGALQVSEKDEFIYHEMIAHVPLSIHPDPEEVLIIGGGDGGTLREVLRQPAVKNVDMLEIDRRVTELSRQYFPDLASGFTDPRARITFDDGVKYMAGCSQLYDVIIVDSSDPVGPAAELFSPEFYRNCLARLKGDGILAVQSESPFFYPEIFISTYKNIAGIFPTAYVYLTAMPAYISGPWSFTIGSKKHDPLIPADDTKVPDGLKYYNKKVHQAAFVLPQYISDMIK